MHFALFEHYTKSHISRCSLNCHCFLFVFRSNERKTNTHVWSGVIVRAESVLTIECWSHNTTQLFNDAISRKLFVFWLVCLFFFFKLNAHLEECVSQPVHLKGKPHNLSHQICIGWIVLMQKVLAMRVEKGKQ